MKYLVLLCLIVTLAFAACKKEDNCVPGFLETVIVGEWRVISFGSSDGDVVFHADGTLEDDDEALIYNTFGDEEFSSITYVIDSDFQMRIRGELATTNDLEFIVMVDNYSCDEINLSVLGVDRTLERK